MSKHRNVEMSKHRNVEISKCRNNNPKKTMKKTLKTAMLLIAACTLTTGFTACSSDDDDNNTVNVVEEQNTAIETLTKQYLNAVVYPNPTDNIAQLWLNGFEIPAGGLCAILHDGNGKQLQTLTVTDDLTTFQIGHYATGTYYLELRNGQRVLKTFKIVRS